MQRGQNGGQAQPAAICLSRVAAAHNGRVSGPLVELRALGEAVQLNAHRGHVGAMHEALACRALRSHLPLLSDTIVHASAKHVIEVGHHRSAELLVTKAREQPITYRAIRKRARPNQRGLRIPPGLE
eukprot:4297416-Pyramimonas_sp.AAC.1